MSADIDNRRAGEAPARVSIWEISDLLSLTRELAFSRDVPLSRLIAFQERKADVLTRLADEEPLNTERSEVAAEARAALVVLYAKRDGIGDGA
jgi:hypothetical protein